ncbi:MAG TPA: G5 domain-containing protein [Acidimicrobiia bacterium]|nr:G5 domain-containing protein [Acidimicrobiia bacterium]
MRSSPARNVAPEPQSWIPIDLLAELPELEELLDPGNLVDSGQTRAVRMGSDGQGYAFVDSEIKGVLEHEKNANRELSHRRWRSRHRTLKLQRRAKIQRVGFISIGVIAIIAAALSLLFILKPSSAVALSQGTSPMIPTVVPVVIEGKATTVLSVASSLEDFKEEQDLTKLVALQKEFDRSDYVAKNATASMEFRYTKKITLTADASVQEITTTDLTVAEVLENNGVVIDGDDVVTPAREAPVQGISAIAITRVSTTTRTQERDVPYAVEKQNDASLRKGTTSIKRAGVTGKETVTYSQTIKDGTVASEIESSRVITRAPVSQILLVGTKTPENESGKASFYAFHAGTCAHKTLPMGTMVTVRNTATGASAVCRVADRGPFVPGRVIDLSKDVFSKIAPLSQGVVAVTLSW